MQPVSRLPDGKYAVETQTGDCRLIWLKTVTGERGEKDEGLFGRRMLHYRTDKGWQAFGFLNDNGALQIHLRFLQQLTPEQQEALRQAVAAIRENPQRATELYRSIDKAKKAAKGTAGAKNPA